MVHRVLTLLLLATAAQAQMYDMKDGNDEGLISPCVGGPVGRWNTEEQANRYPGGPTDGLVLTSSSLDTSCLDTPTTVHLTRKSTLYIAVRVDPRAGNDIFKVWIVGDPLNWIEWFAVTGPIPAGQEWIQESLLIPNVVPEGDYIIRLDDRSSPYNVSLRYFEITESVHSTTDFPGYTGTPDTTVTGISSTQTTSRGPGGSSTTDVTPDPDTTTVVTDTTLNSTKTTERVTTLHPTTERVTTLSPTTERFTTPVKTTQRPSKSPSLY